MGNIYQSKYKWYILTLAALTHTFVIAMPLMCLPVLFKEISDELDLSLVQIGTIWGMGSLAGLFTGILGGLIGDRFGTKRTLGFVCLLAGITGAFRGISGGFVSLAVSVILFGLTTAMIPAAIHKICGVWFSGRHLGLANGVVSMGMALGFSLSSMISATVLSPLLGGWKNVLFLYGAVSVVITLLWFLSREAPGQVDSTSGQTSAVPFWQVLSRIVRVKNVWLFGLIYMGIGGCYQGVFGYLPLYLREVGWSETSADGAFSAFHVASMIAAIPLALLSDRLGLRKLCLFVTALMTAIGVGLLSVAGGAMVWVAVIIAGIVRDGFIGILTAMIIETEGVGAVYTGTAVGLIFTISRIGSIIAPPLGNSLADINLSAPFIFWAALAAVALFGFYFAKETGTKQRAELT